MLTLGKQKIVNYADEHMISLANMMVKLFKCGFLLYDFLWKIGHPQYVDIKLFFVHIFTFRNICLFSLQLKSL